MIHKQRLKSRPITKLTFELPSEYEADHLELVAEFNNWKAVPFTRLKNGKWKLQQEVAPQRSYQFRYRGESNGASWWDGDPNADDSVGNPYGGKNSVVAC